MLLEDGFILQRASLDSWQGSGFRVRSWVRSPSEEEGVAEERSVTSGLVLGFEDMKEAHGEGQQLACECLEGFV